MRNFADADTNLSLFLKSDPAQMSVSERQNVGSHSVISNLYELEKVSMTGKNLQQKFSERRGSYRPQPFGTELYEVESSDTLSGIAARYNITPSELVNLNKLISRTIFPGQIIFVPDNSTNLNLKQIVCSTLESPIVEQESPKPGHVERVQSPIENLTVEAKKLPYTISSKITENLDKESVEKFLKINVKHITDGEGVVSGVLLVTPNLLMFDPNVSDPLVIEHGSEKYGVVAPMQMIVRAALYPDIMRMKVKDSPDSGYGARKPDIFHSKKIILRRSHTEEKIKVPDAFCIPRRSSLTDGKSVVDSFKFSCGNKAQKGSNHDEWLRDISDSCVPCNVVNLKSNKNAETKELSKTPFTNRGHSNSFSEDSEPLPIQLSKVKNSFSSVPVLTTCIENFSAAIHVQSYSNDDISKTKSSSDDDEAIAGQSALKKEKSKNNFEKTKMKLKKGLRKLSITDGFLPAVALNHRRMSLPTSSSFPNMKAKTNFSVQNKKKKVSKSKVETSETSYRNMIDEKPDLFVPLESIDNNVEDLALVPRPAKSFDHSPLYLCLRMGKPIKKSVHRSTPVIQYGKKIKSEYWFSIPQDRVDNLYFFFLRWVPQIYGDIDDVNIEEIGFLPIEHTDDENDGEGRENDPGYVGGRRRSSWVLPWKRRKSKDIVEYTRSGNLSPDWEAEDKEKKIEIDVFPDLLSPSNILNEDHMKKICEHLPARSIGYPWTQIYSTSTKGFSLKTMYREMANYDTPVLLVIASTTGSVFGAFLSCPLRMSDHFYGTGESFLFTFHPEFKCYHWSGENAYFIKGNATSFAVGASEGYFGLWLDDDLFHGRTKQCQTFANDSLCDEEDFVVQALEAWGFV